MVEPTFHDMDNVSKPTSWNLGQVHLKEVALRAGLHYGGA